MIGRGTEFQLDALHGLLTDALTEELKAAMEAVDEDGKPVPINPQLLDKVMKFLTSNGVTAPKGAPKIDKLAAELANIEVDLDGEAMGKAH